MLVPSQTLYQRPAHAKKLSLYHTMVMRQAPSMVVRLEWHLGIFELAWGKERSLRVALNKYNNS
jgi:hypothetical protein